MTTYNPGDVVLVRFPFTDLATTKKRPAVVINTQSYPDKYGDYLLVPLTSVAQDDAPPMTAWQKAGLIKPTWAKPMIVTLSETIVIKHLGRLESEDIATIGCLIGNMIDNAFLRDHNSACPR
jgi:mRNA interferase MazF